MSKLQHYYKGILAEILCVIKLWLRGHKIIGRRVKTPVGEIDLLTLKSGVSYVVEVKYRASSLDDAKIAMLKSQKRIYRACVFLRRQEDVKFLYFAMSGIKTEIGELDYLSDKRGV